MDLDPIKFEKG